MDSGTKTGPDVAKKAFNLPDTADHDTISNAIQQAHMTADREGLKDLDLCMKGNTDDIQNKIAKYVPLVVKLIMRYTCKTQV